MERPKDPLTAATTSILKPAVAPLGFKKLGVRSFGRISDGVLQYFDLQLSRWGSKDFAVNYAAITLCSPRDYFVIQPGGRLPRGKSCDGWWKSSKQEFADNSMRDVIERFTSHCLPWFERTRTTDGLLDELIECNGKISPPKGHYLFDIACCQAKLGKIPEAWGAAEKAAEAFNSFYLSTKADWCLASISKCEQLLDAIRNKQQDQLLQNWEAHSIQRLKLDKILK